MKVLITGGHHNSALVIAEALKEKGYEIVWVGHRHTMITDPHDSLEYQEVTNAGFTFINTLAGKFHSKAHLLHYLRLPLGFLQAIKIILKTRPQLVLAFGGYISVPIGLVARMLYIPLILFEQTSVIGRANQLLSKFSQHNFLAWESSLKYFPENKSSVVGLPLHPSIWQKPQTKFFERHKQTLLITGGKQGSKTINEAVFPLIPKLLKEFNIIHQTGAVSPAKMENPDYLHRPHFSSVEMLEAIKSSNLVISRAGAHIIYELLSLQKRAILIPLPFSYLQEQFMNAQKLSGAIIIDQEELTSEKLFLAIDTLRKQKPVKYMAPPKEATAAVITYITNNHPHA